ncbi:MAG: sigma 54-interacting transcriptional regulator [Pirellulales bacterium]|nr:sigma 54-interacting transcriptional regulator [Pirellulales bacterium]
MSKLAYLVIRDGLKWTDVFRLVPGQSVTIGRAATNQIVVKDDRCSRNHAEIFSSEGQWTLRDLDSRNGTMVGDQRVTGDWVLRPADVIRVGRSQLVFVHHLTEAFNDPPTAVVAPELDATHSDNVLDDDSNVLEPFEPTTITHRRGQTRFLEPSQPSEENQERREDNKEEVDDTGISKQGQAAARLCRIAFELAKAPDLPKMADLALAGLFESTHTDTGALLLLPRDSSKEPDGADLEIVAQRTLAEQRYHRLSNFLATTIMREGEAVLARNVMGDSTLGSRDSKGEILATSVICAPVRHANRTLGLIHLYSTDSRRVPDPDDLEFTLAVADTVAVALVNLNRRQELTENLSQMQDENTQLRERLGVTSEIIGSSQVIRQVTEQIARAAASNATVLIRGESGVGKELVARAIHYSSARSKNTFVCLNCAALSEDLLASELFGHERGAFTGATERKIGKFEAADRGTLMLDEIGEMSPGIQAKFLRVLEGHPFERVGGNKPVKVDVRVIAATNRDLEQDAADGRFRRDLYFRLHVLEIVVPGLRKRLDDIPELAYYFLRKYVDETGRKIEGFSDAALQQLITYRWPGNVRELKNVIERAVVLCRGRLIDQGDLLLSKLPTAGPTGQLGPADRFNPCSLADLERDHILATLQHTAWNKSRAATHLGIERSTLDRKIRRYRLTEESPSSGN